MDAGHWSSQRRKPAVERYLAHRKRVTSLKVSPDLHEALETWSCLAGSRWSIDNPKWIQNLYKFLVKLRGTCLERHSLCFWWAKLQLFCWMSWRLGNLILRWMLCQVLDFWRNTQNVFGFETSHLAHQKPSNLPQAVSTSWDGWVKLWDYRAQRLRFSFDSHLPSPVTALAFAPSDGRFFVTTGGDAKLSLFARRWDDKQNPWKKAWK